MKKNIFAETYAQVQELKKAYDAAADEAGKEKVRAGYHALMEGIEGLGAAACRIWREYETAMENGNACLDISEVVWDKDVESLVTCMRENGIGEFTFSSGLNLCQYFGQKKSKDYAAFFSSSSSFCCGVK